MKRYTINSSSPTASAFTREPYNSVWHPSTPRFPAQVVVQPPKRPQDFLGTPKSRSVVIVGEPKYTRVKNGQFPNGTSITRDHNVSAPIYRESRITSAQARRNVIDSTVGPLAGIAGGAALLNPAVLPVAAGLGIGYGAYKLGEGLGIW